MTNEFGGSIMGWEIWCQFSNYFFGSGNSIRIGGVHRAKNNTKGKRINKIR